MSEQNQTPPDFLETPHELSKIDKIIGVVSGKGGVGKSLVTSMMAIGMNRKGYKTAVLDADVTGPSIPKAFGIEEKATANELGLFPVKSQTGIDVMSVNLLLDNVTDPVVWRGPMIANTVKQFWTDVIWQDEDFMFIDMPPGTGDVPLTVFQSIPVDGIIIVTSPQDLVAMIVAKAVNMAKMMNVPILGIVENMSYFECPDCGNTHHIFGESSIDAVAGKFGIPVIGKLPIDPKIAESCDIGKIELYQSGALNEMVDTLDNLLDQGTPVTKKEEGKKIMLKIAVATENAAVAQHFGHCATYTMFTTEEGKITNTESIVSPEHVPGLLPKFLGEKGADVVIAGGMGAKAVELFNVQNIEVITGATGDPQKNAELYLAGSLVSTGSVCHEHAHADSCGDH
jgi:Mrp family chromosome partitioning ATPase/predicted Fe-Mo cluster-binding NifX family protein